MREVTVDFQDLLQHEGTVLHPWFERAHHWIVLPHALDVAKRSDGSPDFQLDLVRARSGDFAGYGVVDFRATPVLDLDAAQRLVPEDVVTPGYFSGGWLRLMVRDVGSTDPTTLLPALPVTSTGLGVVRLATQMTADGAVLIRDALLDGTAVIEAWAEMGIEGIAPRLPVVVGLRWADVQSALALEGGAGAVTRAALVGALAQPGVVSGVTAEIDVRSAAEATADRLLARIGTRVPSPERDFEEWWQLTVEAGDTRFEWDLRRPAPAVRTRILRFDPVGLVRSALAAGGLERLITERELDEFDTGYVPVTIAASLADVRTPVLSCGVDVTAPPNPPNRRAAIQSTVEFQPPHDRQDLVMRFSPGEPACYEFQTFVFARTGFEVHEWRSSWQRHQGAELRLGPIDFAARFVPVTASARLLSEGAVTMTARWDGVVQSVELSAAHPTDTLVSAATAEQVEYACRVEKTGQVLETAVPAAPTIWLDFPLFREFGSHSVDIEIDFAGADGMVALDVKPETADQPAASLVFTSARPARTWSFLAPSPFAPGYVYRAFRTNGPALPWSAVQSPFEPLRLQASALTTDDDAGARQEG